MCSRYDHYLFHGYRDVVTVTYAHYQQWWSTHTLPPCYWCFLARWLCTYTRVGIRSVMFVCVCVCVCQALGNLRAMKSFVWCRKLSVIPHTHTHPPIPLHILTHTHTHTHTLPLPAYTLQLQEVCGASWGWGGTGSEGGSQGMEDQTQRVLCGERFTQYLCSLFIRGH